ncbi:unnamed protein product, partial [Porites lobata]
MNTTLAIDKSTPETPSPSSMLLVSSTVVSQQSGTFVLMTSASVLSSDHTNSKSRGLLDAAVN